MIVVSFIPAVCVLVYLLIGLLAARRWAISGEAFIALLFAWPLFAVLALASPIINWWVNRNL